MLPLAEGILAAGKAALLLQAYSSWRLAAAAARRAGSLGGGGAAAAAAGSGSPSKRRLSEFGALGFAIAAGQQGPGQQHPYGVPPPALAAAEGLALFVGTGEAPGPEPLPLHQQLERNLEERLQETALAASSGRGGASAGLALPAAAAAAVAEVAGSASPGSTSSSGGGASSGSRACHAEWAAAAACGDHTLLLPPGDLLPPLPAVPASAEELPATAAATIPPPPLAPEPLGADSQAHAAAQAQRSSGGKGASTSGELSMAERMRAAAAARVAQATCAALDQLQQLIIPPAPLEALAAAAGADAAALAATPEAAAAAARQFDGGAWQQWYARVATSLSQRLQVLDSLRGSSGGGAAAASAATSRPIGSFGVPLGLPRYTGASPSEQLWGRGGTPGSGGSGSALLGGGAAPPLRAELAAEAPPLDVLLQDSLLRPVRAQVDAAGGALCTALLRHGLLRQVRRACWMRAGAGAAPRMCPAGAPALMCSGSARPLTLPAARQLPSHSAQTRFYSATAGGAARHAPAGLAAAGAVCLLPAAPHQASGCGVGWLCSMRGVCGMGWSIADLAGHPRRAVQLSTRPAAPLAAWTGCQSLS